MGRKAVSKTNAPAADTTKKKASSRPSTDDCVRHLRESEIESGVSADVCVNMMHARACALARVLCLLSYFFSLLFISCALARVLCLLSYFFSLLFISLLSVRRNTSASHGGRAPTMGKWSQVWASSNLPRRRRPPHAARSSVTYAQSPSGGGHAPHQRTSHAPPIGPSFKSVLPRLRSARSAPSAVAIAPQSPRRTRHQAIERDVQRSLAKIRPRAVSSSRSPPPPPTRRRRQLSPPPAARHPRAARVSPRPSSALCRSAPPKKTATPARRAAVTPRSAPPRKKKNTPVEGQTAVAWVRKSTRIVCVRNE
jgi:hypothetical protein